MKDKLIRSPLFYVGDKFKLMPQLSKLFPKKIDSFYDVFCGGGSVSLNTKANIYHMNDSNKRIIELHNLLLSNSLDMLGFINKAKSLSINYGFSISEDNEYLEIEKLKKNHKKTYYAIFNKEPYLKLRHDYNSNKDNTILLYLLLIYGFNHMVRFNKSGEFNLPVGNVDWNKNVTTSLINYGNWAKRSTIKYTYFDFEEFIEKQTFTKNDFLYFDPPYLITSSEYNKFWTTDEEIRLLNLLDILDKNGLKWGLSNMLVHKGYENKLLREWSKKYNVYQINSNYISRFDNSVKNSSEEIYVTNYSSNSS